MHKNTGTNATPDNLFTDGDPQNDIPRSLLESDIMNTIMLELVNAVEGAGLTLDTGNDGQLRAAIQQISGVSAANPSAIINGGCLIAQLDQPTTLDDAAEPLFGPVDMIQARVDTVAGTALLAQASATWSASGKCAQVSGLDTSAAANSIDFVYRIESRDAQRFAQQAASFACTLHQNSGVIITATIKVEACNEIAVDDWSGAKTLIATGSATNVPHASAWPVFLSIPDMGACAKGVQITITLDIPSGVAASTDYQISELRFNAGDQFVGFSPSSYTDELAACRRYYERYSISTLDLLAHMSATSTTALRGYLRYAVPKRTEAVNVSITAAADLEVIPGSAAISQINEAGGNLSLDGAHIEAISTGLTADNAYLIRAKDGELVDIKIDARIHPINVQVAGNAPAAPASITTPTGTDADGDYSVSWDASVAATGYQLIEQYNDGTWTLIADQASLSKSFLNKANGNWQYAVRAYNGYGFSVYTYSTQFAVDQSPAAPASITVPTTTDTDGNFAVSWDSSAGATSYALQRRKDGGAWTTIQDSAGTSYGESGLGDGNYDYRVQACNASGCSVYTTSTTVVVNTPPDAPTLEVSRHFGSVDCDWTAEAGATVYELQINEDNAGWSQVYIGTDTAFTLMTTSDKQIFMRVRAGDGVSFGDWSGSVEAVIHETHTG